MSVYGYLHTMSLPDLLQWASHNNKTGILELERNKVCRRITFRDGRIVACSSDDPPSRLGQFLLSRGKISKETLRESLARQERTGQNLGMIFQEMGVLTREEIESHVAAKAEENIYGLFDWPDAVFRFYHESTNDPFIIEVDLSVEDVLLRGIQRVDELQRIRQIFRSSGIVLERTSSPAPREVEASPMARRVFESIDGERAIAEILLRAHTSEFLVVKFLFTLYRKNIVRVKCEHPTKSDSATVLDTFELDGSLPRQDGRHGGEPHAGIEDDLASPSTEAAEDAMQKMSRGEYREALEVLNAVYRACPDDNHLRQLVLQAESGYLKAARLSTFSPQRIPVPVGDPTVDVDSKLLPTELFLLTMLDGQTDIKSLVWVAPMREVDVVLALEHMYEAGAIQLCDPVDAESQDSQGPRAVEWSPF